MKDQQTTSTGTGCPGWAKLLLIASLALNAGAIGFYATMSMKDGSKSDTGSRQIDWILKLVPDERRDFTKAHFADIRGELRALQATRNELLDQIVSAIRAEPFAPDALDAVLAERRAASLERRNLVHERLVSLMVEFTPEERTVFADRLTERLERLRARRDE